MFELPTVKSIPLETRLQIIAEAAAASRALYMERCWIETDEDGFTGWRWDKFNVTLVIVCAANRYKDFIITGTRHYSVPMWSMINLVGIDALNAYANADDDPEENNESGYQQGFIDQYGGFWGRREAMDLCKWQGRPLLEEGRSTKELFSEHLY
jgi:hypothetical protein